MGRHRGCCFPIENGILSSSLLTLSLYFFPEIYLLNSFNWGSHIHNDGMTVAQKFSVSRLWRICWHHKIQVVCRSEVVPRMVRVHPHWRHLLGKLRPKLEPIQAVVKKSAAKSMVFADDLQQMKRNEQHKGHHPLSVPTSFGQTYIYIYIHTHTSCSTCTRPSPCRAKENEGLGDKWDWGKIRDCQKWRRFRVTAHWPGVASGLPKCQIMGHMSINDLPTLTSPSCAACWRRILINSNSAFDIKQNYSLVNSQFANLNMAIEIVDLCWFTHLNWWFSANCGCWPEGPSLDQVQCGGLPWVRCLKPAEDPLDIARWDRNCEQMGIWIWKNLWKKLWKNLWQNLWKDWSIASEKWVLEVYANVQTKGMGLFFYHGTP